MSEEEFIKQWEEQYPSKSKKHPQLAGIKDPKEYSKQWRLLNKDKIKQYLDANRERDNRTKREYYGKNKEKFHQTAKEYAANHKKQLRAYRKKYNKENKNNVRSQKAIYRRERMKSDINFKLKCTIRSRLYSACKRRNHYKTGSAVNDLGCSIQIFKWYISTKFTSGMTWENHGEWHLDHIIPLASFDLTIKEQFLKACHYTNYQPLWAEDNLEKRAKMPTFTFSE